MITRVEEGFTGEGLEALLCLGTAVAVVMARVIIGPRGGLRGLLGPEIKVMNLSGNLFLAGNRSRECSITIFCSI